MLFAIQQMWRAVRWSLGTAITVLTAAYFWSDIRDLPSAYGYEWGQFVPDREKVLFGSLCLALLWIVWVDVRPTIKAYLIRKAPLDVKPAFHFPSSLNGYVLLVTNTSPDDVENISVYLRQVKYAGIVRPVMSPLAEGYLLFEGDRESASLRPGETAAAPFIRVVEDGEKWAEFGPFKNGTYSRGWRHSALVVELIVYSKAYPPHRQSIWVRREPQESGASYTFGVGNPSYADLGYPENIQALERGRRRWLARRLTG